MKVLMISGDKNFLRPGTGAYARYQLQKAQVEKLEVLVWPQEFFKPLFMGGQFDVVTSQDPFWRGLIALFLAKRFKAKLNVQVHADLSAQSATKHMLSQIILRHAHSVRVVSEALKKQVSKSTKAAITVLPVFIDLSKFIGIAHVPHPRFQKTILWSGRFEAEKDPLYALEVLGEVRKTGVDAGLIMLGSGSLLETLKEEAKERELFDFVEFPGWKDTRPYLAQADMVLCTSREESWGASIVEALAAGVATVAPDVGVAREAGATVVPKEELGKASTQVLKEGLHGNLILVLPSAAEWAEQWKKILQL